MTAQPIKTAKPEYGRDLLNAKLPAVPVKVTTLQLVGAWKGVVRNILAATVDFTQHVVWAVVGSGHWAAWIWALALSACSQSLVFGWFYARERTVFLHLQMCGTGSNGIASPVCCVSNSICFNMLPARFVWSLPYWRVISISLLIFSLPHYSFPLSLL